MRIVRQQQILMTRKMDARRVSGRCLMELMTIEIMEVPMHKLHESTAATDTESLGGGKYRIRIIVPGQGSSGIYTAENLAASAPLFKAGTEMFIDHPTESEEWERPERSIRDYAGVFLEDATVGEDGALYTVCKVFSGVNDLIKDKWEHIGVSINAWCADPINESGIVPPIAGVRSVDFVTAPGAGGAIVDLLESNRAQYLQEKEEDMDEEIKSSFSAIEDKISSVLEAIGKVIEGQKVEEAEEPAKEAAPAVDVDAVLEAGKKLAEAALPEAAAKRVRESVKAGADIEEAIEAEREYLKEATAKSASPHVEEDSLKESYKKIGWV
nr:MAG TPA: Prohead core protein protease [Caudoviricetes sp.]